MLLVKDREDALHQWSTSSCQGPLLLRKAGAVSSAASAPARGHGHDGMQPAYDLTGMGASKASGQTSWISIMWFPGHFGHSLPLDFTHNKAIMGFSVCLGSVPYGQQLYPGRGIVQPRALLSCTLGVFHVWHLYEIGQKIAFGYVTCAEHIN